MMVPKFLDLKGLASTFILSLLGKKTNIRAIGFEENYCFFFFFHYLLVKKKKKKSTKTTTPGEEGLLSKIII